MNSRKFISKQFRRVSIGILFGSLLAAILHLTIRDTLFLSSVHLKWRSLGVEHQFEGFNAYMPELYTFLLGFFALVLLPVSRYSSRFARAWWAGITSITTTVSAGLTTAVLFHGFRYASITIVSAILALATVIGAEFWRQANLPPARFSNELRLHIPARVTQLRDQQNWDFAGPDDPIGRWNQDIIGRTAVVELLAEHALKYRTPVIALHGDFGDGKTSVLHLLQQAVQGKAIVVSFSAWLPGTETNLASDLFADIATECRNYVHVPQLRKHAAAYARILGGSVSYLAGLREILPPQSQREEIEELRNALARVPLPILVLLDDVDRMQREEILVLLKILRGAASMPNLIFICAFSEREIRRELGDLSSDYLEKFFPVSIKLASISSEMLGSLFHESLISAFREQNWFASKETEAKVAELLERFWGDFLSQICTNLRKLGLLLRDIVTAARPIIGEVNAFDLVVIETIRLFYPDVYRAVRTHPLFLTYPSNNWSKGRIFGEEEKKEGAAQFFKALNAIFPNRMIQGRSRECLAISSLIMPTQERADVPSTR